MLDDDDSGKGGVVDVEETGVRLLGPDEVLAQQQRGTLRTAVGRPAGQVAVHLGLIVFGQVDSPAERVDEERALRERVSSIVEGVHAHPRLAEKIADSDAVVLHIMLAILKKGKLKQRIKGRATQAVQRRAQEYLDHFDEIWQLQSYLLAEADDTNTPIIVNGDREEVVQEIMRTLVEQLSGSRTPSPDRVLAESS